MSAWTYRLRQGRPKDCSTLSSDPMMEGPGADSEEKREPVSDINTVGEWIARKRLTLNGRLEKRTSAERTEMSTTFRQLAAVSLQLTDVRCHSFYLSLVEITRNGLHSG